MLFLLLCKECRRAERGSSREDETNTHCAATLTGTCTCTSIDAIDRPPPSPVPCSLHSLFLHH